MITLLKFYNFVRVLALCIVLGSATAQASENLVPIEVHGANGRVVTLQVEVVNTPETRAHGLMDRRELPNGQGMLFDFHKPTWVKMWMYRTFIPLDMVFIDDAGLVVAVHPNAIPHDRTVIASPVKVRAVLELAGGQAQVLGIAAGGRVISKEVEVFAKKR